jgi:gas vesicle protein
MERAHVCDFLAGIGIGVVTALLLAPRTGRETRSKITGAAADGTAYLKRCGETVRDAAMDTMKQGKDEIARHVGRHKEGLTEAFRKGSEAYRRAVS